LADYLSIFVERKKRKDARSRNLADELRSALKLEDLGSLRIICLYEIIGIEAGELLSSAAGLLFEPNNDEVSLKHPILQTDEILIARELLPGQFDQRADSAARGLGLIHPENKIRVQRSDLFILKGRFRSGEEESLRRWLINPVESREKDLSRTSLYDGVPEPGSVTVLAGFRNLDSRELEELRQRESLALSSEDLKFILSWYAGNEGRDPTLAEIKALDTYWSDHCRHTTFETILGSVNVAEGPEADEIIAALDGWGEARAYCNRENKPKTLMDLATIAAREARLKGELEDWDISEEINACTLKVDALIDGERQPWLLSFKNETHNHPTEIEPYGGASTCLGGAVRDPLSGRAYVHQALRVSGGADPRQNPADARPGKLPQRLIAHGAAGGYAGYGNQLGLATAVVREFYHPGYEAKRLECGAVMGASPASHVIREEPVPGDRVILVGGRTGRDGIGGATGSSVVHDESSLKRAGAEVQKGNPPEERKLQRLFRNPAAARLIRRCNDFGAGGVAVAVGELAPGVEINLDAVPMKYQGLNGLELALSESQERMAVVVHPEDEKKFIHLAAEENLEAVRVAEITAERRLRMNWRGESVINLSRDLLDTNGVLRTAEVMIPAGHKTGYAENTVSVSFDNLNLNRENLKRVISSVELASRRGLEERFDGSVGGTTVLASHGGIRQLTPAEASVHLLPAGGEVETAGLMSIGFDPVLASLSPFRGGQYALIEALAKVCAVGGSWRKTRFSLQEFFGRTDRGPEAWGEPLAALLGALTVQREWGLPAIGGKDSMSGSFEELNVPPTIIAFAAGAMDASRAVSAALPSEGLTLVLVSPGVSRGSYPGSPDFGSLASGWDWIESLGGRGHLKSAASSGRGGWAAKLVLMCLGNNIGAELEYMENPFSLEYGGVLIASDLSSESLQLEADKAGAEIRLLGRSTAEPVISWPGGSIGLKEVSESWRDTFAEIWPEDRCPDAAMELAPGSSGSQDTKGSAGKYQADFSVSGKTRGRPGVCIPVFPGTNGEDDALRAFFRAGGEVTEHIFLDRDPGTLDAALTGLARSIDESQILFLSGGFSAGDEPDGAGKYIAAVLRQERVAAALYGLLERDGLILGICNGFQALVKSGWLINGAPGVPEENDPTLTHNRIGRHVARVVRTVATGAESPWLSKINRGDVHSMPVSHGEGRFTAAEEVLKKLVSAGRIAFQYSDEHGIPGMGGDVNPNGSDMAVEGIISPCGRILGKMGHSERWRKGTLIDIPGMETEQPLISGGVEWFL